MRAVAFAIVSLLLGPGHSDAGEAAGQRAGDDMLSCEQIVAELSPLAERLAAGSVPLFGLTPQFLGDARLTEPAVARDADDTSCAAADAAVALATFGLARGPCTTAAPEVQRPPRAQVPAARPAKQRSPAEPDPRVDGPKADPGTPLASLDTARINRLKRLADEKRC